MPENGLYLESDRSDVRTRNSRTATEPAATDEALLDCVSSLNAVVYFFQFLRTATQIEIVNDETSRFESHFCCYFVLI